MDDIRVLYNTFNIYYEKALDAVSKCNYEVGKRNFYQAANTLLSLSKLSEGELKTKRYKRALELISLGDKIVVPATSSSFDNQYDISASSVNEITAENNETVELQDAMNSLNNLIGLENVKKQVFDWIEQIKIFKIREQKGLKVTSMSYHLIFTGNPGTGKTTIARIIAKIYCALGITKTSKFLEVTREDLVAGYVGQTDLKTRDVLNKARGGVLFIDEAYRLANSSSQDFGKEAIETLLKYMEDYRDDLIVIAAGYKEPMQEFINANPGLQSRFKTTIEFDDYSPEALFDIFMSCCDKNDYTLTNDAESLLKKIIRVLHQHKTETFGNGREMRNLFENVVTNQSIRLGNISNPTIQDLMTITEEDIPLNIPGLQLEEYEDDSALNTLDNSSNDINNNTYINSNDDYETPKSINDIYDENTALDNACDNPNTIELEGESSAEQEFLDNKDSQPDDDFKFEWNDLPEVTFDDVVGLEDVKKEVKIKVLLPIKNPELFDGYEKKNGGGLLLFGPPGTGKTMIAAAIANEIGAKFCNIKPSDLLHQGAGNTEKAVRSLFAQARKFPCSIIFFDEMDSIAQKNTRSSYAKQLRSELLAQLQGIESYGKETNNILYLIAATNKPWDVDSAFIRPGRFGTRIYVGLPNGETRLAIIKNKLDAIQEHGIVTINDDINYDELMDLTVGFNCSDISNLIDKAQELSIVRSLTTSQKVIKYEDFLTALESVKSSVQAEDIEKLQAWAKENNIR